MLDANHRGDVDTSIDALQRIYDEAVCAGGTLSARAAQERLHSPLELLAAITTPWATARRTRPTSPIVDW
jgi:hypothetical protein